MNIKFKIKNLKLASGFTLAEMLVVVSVLAILGIIFTEIFIRSLRGNYKAQTINKIKQEGQTVLNTLGDQIKDSDRVVSCDKDDDDDAYKDTILLVKGTAYSRYYFKKEPTEGTPANGYIELQSSIAGLNNLSTQQLQEICRDATTSATVFGAAQYLTDTDPKTGVSLKLKENIGSSGFVPFVATVNQEGFKDIVEIEFTLSAGVDAPNMIVGKIDPIPFITTVGLR